MKGEKEPRTGKLRNQIATLAAQGVENMAFALRILGDKEGAAEFSKKVGAVAALFFGRPEEK